LQGWGLQGELKHWVSDAEVGFLVHRVPEKVYDYLAVEVVSGHP
jgi:hypothetical protein